MKKTALPFYFFTFLVMTFAGKTHAQPGYISTVAGSGLSGFSGDGNLAIYAKMSGPAGTAVDSSGNLYISDYGNNRIRKVNHATGIITTIAGNGTAAYSGDGGPAINAAIQYPDGIKLDAAGNIYFADQGNSCIRKISATTGIITTVAGTGTAGYNNDNIPATSAELNYASGIAFDATGDMYISDWQNHRIRKITMSTGIITTIAGTGAAGYSGDGGAATLARLYRPSGLAFDNSGNLYISEYGNSTVRKVAAGTGIITTVAGTGAAGYTGDSVAASTSKLNQPLDVATDAAGNIYIADWNNYRVRMVDASSGIISTIAGNGIEGYAGDGGPAVDALTTSIDGLSFDTGGNLYISDEYVGVVRKIECPTCSPAVVPITENMNSISLYPNPATTFLMINCTKNINTLTVTDMLGRTVYSNKYCSPSIRLSINDLPAGFYFARINGIAVKKFIKE